MKTLSRALLAALILCPAMAGAQIWEAPADAFEYSVENVYVSSTGAVFASIFLGDLYRSNDRGATWTPVLDELVQGIVESGGALYAASLGGVFVSHDDGDTWSTIMPSDTWSISVDGSVIVAGGGGGQLYRSDDGGATWSVENCQFMPQGYDSYVEPVFARDDVTLYTHGFGSFFAGTGASWFVDDGFGPDFFVSDGDMIYANDIGEIIKSRTGTSWGIHSESPFYFLEDLSISGDEWAVASFSGVAVSKDGGETWIDWSAGLGGAESVAIDAGGFVYAASGRLVVRSATPISQATGTAGKRERELPESGFIASPYPNPAAGLLIVPFIVSAPGHVEITIYDVAGRRIESLIDRFVPAGKHDIRWSPRGIPSGTYFVRMVTGGQTLTRNIILVP